MVRMLLLVTIPRAPDGLLGALEHATDARLLLPVTITGTPLKRTKTAAYLHQGLTTRANGPGQQDGERQVQ